MRFALFALTALLIALLAARPALADQPITVTGVLDDQDPVTGQAVTRTITLTMLLPTNPYTGTVLTSGAPFVFEQSATYGDVVAGAGSCSLVLAFLLWVTLRLSRRKI